MNARPTLRERASGVLLHLTSLPGGHGIGDLGAGAHAFVDFLARARQRWWQILPIGPTGRSGSPYLSPSAFAGNPLLISLEALREEGWLSKGDLDGPPFPRGRVAFNRVARFKEERLRRAFCNFERGASRGERARVEAFAERAASWLPDYALFRALRAEARGAAWTDWDPDLRSRRSAALARARARLRHEIRYWVFVEEAFARQWEALRRRCAARGVGLIGDVPVFVSPDSADVWAHADLFALDARGRPALVAGTPPDYFSATGQLWGNPVYRWTVHRRSGYAWWIARFRNAFERVDAVRLDHFIGYRRFWAVPGAERTARRGRWRAGPGAPFFEAVLGALGPLEWIAEDLGVVTPEVKALRDAFGFPGCRVLQFAFGNDPEAENYQPHNYPRRCVVYTGTHDNDTTLGWFRDAGSRSSARSAREIREERAFALRYLGTRSREVHWDFIRLAWMSVADTAIVPAQDLLGLGSRARMNVPGRERGNWAWRLPNLEALERVGDRLRRLTETYGRAARGGRSARRTSSRGVDGLAALP